MISFFTPAINDQSIYYLDQMYGYMNNVLPVDTGALTIMGAMFETINATALVVGSFIVIYTIIVGIFKTASEGEFLGKQWSSFWIPFRTVFGVAALFPTPAGYSLLQIVIMWIVVQGIGTADTLWTTVLQYVTVQGTPYYKPPNTTSGSSTISGNVTLPPLMSSLFEALVCQSALARTDSDVYQTGNGDYQQMYYCRDKPSDAFCKMTATDRLNITATPGQPVNQYYNYKMGPNGACGTLSFPDPASYVDTTSSATTAKGVACKNTADVESTLTCAGIKQQIATMQTIVNTLAVLADDLVEYDNEYWKFFYGNQQLVPNTNPALVITAPSYPTPGWIGKYCTDNKINAADCCIKNLGNPLTCATGSLANFFTPFVSQSNANDYSDAPTNLGTKIYWPYGLGAIIGLNTDETQILTQKYLTDINAAMASALSAGGADITNNYMSDANNNGWVTAGTYYYFLASLSNSVQSGTMPKIAIITSNQSQSAKVGGYRMLWQTAADVLAAISAATSPAPPTSGPPGLAKPNSALNGATAGITKNFMSELSGGGISTNPLISAQAFGEDLLISAQVTYPFMLIASVALIVGFHINGMGLGVGLTKNPAGPGVTFAVMMAWALYMFFAGWCFTFGGMLAVYLPLVPYIIFIFGAMGWFIAVIEAMVAAPFVALGIVMPVGHDMMGRAEPALMIMLNVFLRPTLMVTGMMAGMLLAPAVVTMINNGFNVVVGSIYGGSHAPGPVELMLFISAYGSIIITALNKCFALIFMIPERTLTWIGGQAISYGESDSLNIVKYAVEGAAGAVKSGASSTGKQALGAAQKKNEQDKEKGKKKEGAGDASLSAG